MTDEVKKQMKEASKKQLKEWFEAKKIQSRVRTCKECKFSYNDATACDNLVASNYTVQSVYPEFGCNLWEKKDD